MQHLLLIDRYRRLLDLRLQPLALACAVEVHELDGDRSAVEGAGLLRSLAVGDGDGERLRRQKLPEWVERRLQVAPAAKHSEDLVTFCVCLDRFRSGNSSLGGHNSPHLQVLRCFAVGHTLGHCFYARPIGLG